MTTGDASDANVAENAGPSASSTVGAEPARSQPNTAQGEVEYTDADIRAAIDEIIEQSQRVVFVSLDRKRKKIVFKSIGGDDIPESEVQKRLQAVLEQLDISARTSDVIRYAKTLTDGIALLA